MNTACHVGCVEVIHIATRLTGLGASDHQQRIERPDQSIRFLDRPLKRDTIVSLTARFCERLLCAVSQPCQGRFQVVRDIVGDLL